MIYPLFLSYYKMSGINILIKINTTIPKKKLVHGLISYGNSEPVSYEELNKFKNGIDNTFAEYVYPRVFTKGDKNIKIPEEKLYKLRIWANVYRHYKNMHTTEYNLYYLYRLFLQTRTI